MNILRVDLVGCIAVRLRVTGGLICDLSSARLLL